MRLYQPYEQKILQIAEIKEKIMRYKYIILACFLAILAGIAALLYFKGDIQKDIQLQQTYTYGDTISCEATAFFAKPTIEFYQNDQRIDKTPEYPGQYKARVVTKGSFGIKKYGEWHNFIIQQKPASYTVETSFTYGEYPSVRMDGLCENDRLVYDETQVRFIDLELSQPKAEILSGAIKILNQENESVEHCYLFNNGAVGVYEVQLQARKIVLNTGSISKEYDGKVTSCSQYEIADGSLAFEDYIQTSAFPKLEAIGFLKNQVTFSFFNKEGVDVGKYYNPTIFYGTLNVTEKAMTISTQAVSKVYDGDPFPMPEVQTQGLIEGHTIDRIAGNWEFEPGVYKNSLAYDVIDENGKSVKGNYSIQEDFAKAIIYTEEIIVSLQEEKVYDGNVLTICSPVFVQGELEPSETFVIEKWRAYDSEGNVVHVKDAGVYRAEILEYQIQSTNPNVDEYYMITLQEGKCTVSQREITVQLQDKAKYYDRTPLASTDVSVVAGEVVQGQTLKVEAEGSITNPGSKTNTLTEVLVEENGVDVSKNYIVTKKNGKLTVLKRSVSVYPLPLAKTYDGTPLAYPDGLDKNYCAYVEWADSNDSGYSLEVSGDALLSGDYLQVDEIVFEKTLVNTGGTYVSVKGTILDSAGNSMKDYYDITFEEATAVITPVYLRIVSLSHSKVYDGEPLIGSVNDCYIAIGKLLSDEVITFEMSGEQCEIGVSKNVIKKVEIRRGDVVVACVELDDNGKYIYGRNYNNYEIEVICGDLEVK